MHHVRYRVYKEVLKYETASNIGIGQTVLNFIHSRTVKVKLKLATVALPLRSITSLISSGTEIQFQVCLMPKFMLLTLGAAPWGRVIQTGREVKVAPPRADTLGLFGDNEESTLASVTALGKRFESQDKLELEPESSSRTG